MGKAMIFFYEFSQNPKIATLTAILVWYKWLCIPYEQLQVWSNCLMFAGKYNGYVNYEKLQHKKETKKQKVCFEGFVDHIFAFFQENAPNG